MGGIPALVFPERKLDDLPTILASTGAVVTSQPSAPERVGSRKFAKPSPGIDFLCEFEKDVTVRVTCEDGKQHGLDGMLTVLDVVRPCLWKARTATRRLRQIEGVLREHGATDPVPDVPNGQQPPLGE